jgi:hypothetical protein
MKTGKVQQVSGGWGRRNRVIRPPSNLHERLPLLVQCLLALRHMSETLRFSDFPLWFPIFPEFLSSKFILLSSALLNFLLIFPM